MSKANQLKVKYSNHKSNRTSVSQLHSLKIWPNKNKRPNVIQSTRKHTYAEVEKSTCNQGTVTICTKSWNSFSNIRFWMSLDHARWSPSASGHLQSNTLDGKLTTARKCRRQWIHIPPDTKINLPNLAACICRAYGAIMLNHWTLAFASKSTRQRASNARPSIRTKLPKTNAEGTKTVMPKSS